MLKDNPTIILSRTDRMGDLVLSFPSIKRLRLMYPHCKLILLVKQYTFDLVRFNPYIDLIITIDTLSYDALLKLLLQEHPDVFIALFTDSFISRLAKKSRAKIKIGPLSKLSSFFSYPQGVIQHRSQAKKNEAMYNLDLVRHLNPSLFDKFKDCDSELFFPPEYQDHAAANFSKMGIPPVAKVILVHPFTGGSTKNLSLEQYVSLVKIILEQDQDVHIIISSVRNDEPLLHKYFDMKAERLHTFINDGSILDFAALLQYINLYIGASTGPTHVAGCMQKKIVAVYPKILIQSPIRWGIINNSQVQYVQPDVNCSFKYGCRKHCPVYDCFTTIDLPKMATQCLKLLDQE